MVVRLPGNRSWPWSIPSSRQPNDLTSPAAQTMCCSTGGNCRNGANWLYVCLYAVVIDGHWWLSLSRSNLLSVPCVRLLPIVLHILPSPSYMVPWLRLPMNWPVVWIGRIM